MRDTRTLMDFFDGDDEFDQEAFRADAIDNLHPRGTHRRRPASDRLSGDEAANLLT